MFIHQSIILFYPETSHIQMLHKRTFYFGNSFYRHASLFLTTSVPLWFLPLPFTRANATSYYASIPWSSVNPMPRLINVSNIVMTSRELKLKLTHKNNWFQILLLDYFIALCLHVTSMHAEEVKKICTYCVTMGHNNLELTGNGIGPSNI